MPSSDAILLIAALRSEIAPAARQLGLTWQGPCAHGKHAGKQIIACVTGVGRQRMLAALEHMLSLHRVNRVVLVGYAGGLAPALHPGQAIAIAKVCNEQHHAIDLAQPGQTLLTVNEPALTAAAKHQLYAQHHAAAVDMETYHVAAMLEKRALPFTVIRAISDPASADLPEASLSWVTPTGDADVRAAMCWLSRQPWRVLALVRLGHASAKASRALAREVMAFVAGHAGG